MKKSVLLVALVASLSTSAFANNTATQEDLNFAFNNLQLENVTLLSKQEMEETKGEFLPFVPIIVGAVVGAGSYYAFDDDPTVTGAIMSAGFGAMSGGASGALIKAAGGGLAANVAWRPGFLGLNYGVNKVIQHND